MLYFEEWRKGNKNSIKIFLVVLPDWVVVSWMKTFSVKMSIWILSGIAANVEGPGVEEKMF